MNTAEELTEGGHQTFDLELPDLQEAVLSADQLKGYIAELQATGADVTVRIKGELTERPVEVPHLDLLLERLQVGRVHSAQLRYVYEGAPWVDTLMIGAEGARLVRIRL